METGECLRASRLSRKRKSAEENEDGSSRFGLDHLNQDVLEQVLSWLPTSTFLGLTSVCKRWKSVANSATFHLACSQVPSRDPWFLMVDSDQPHLSSPPIVFDSSGNNWKKLNLMHQKQDSNWGPVASSGGLVCFQNAAESELIVCNPVTGECQEIVSSKSHLRNCEILKAIAMISTPDSYSILLVSGEFPELRYRAYNSRTKVWGAEVKLSRKIHSSNESILLEEENPMYFLSKCGNVVSTDLQRNPCKKYSSVTTRKNGEEMVHFLSSSGAVVTCNLTTKCYYEFPRLLPLHYEYSIDLVECKGEIYVVVLQEFLESASLRVWRFDETAASWHQIAAMPPALSHEFFGKKVDINCSGACGQILVCLNSEEICCSLLCNLVANEWIELPNCYANEKMKEFVCAFGFEPRIEARSV